MEGLLSAGLLLTTVAVTRSKISDSDVYTHVKSKVAVRTKRGINELFSRSAPSRLSIQLPSDRVGTHLQTTSTQW